MVADEPDRRIAADVLPAEIDDLAIPVELNQLFPWHRPRKQLVREEQWIRYSRRLIAREKGRSGLIEPVEGNPEVRYLTLPGIDYLDVRQLADVCRENGCSLTSTGFLQSGAEGNTYVARAQLREKSLIDAGHITGHSYTFPRRFEDIVSINGQAYRDMKTRGPFHIVNIDACGSIAAPQANHATRLIDALYRIVEIQMEIAIGRWLLFVTTDVRPDSIAEETLDSLCQAIFENADSSDEFRNRAIPFLGPGQLDIRAAATIASERPGTVFLQLFSLGLAKWLLHLAGPRNWDMKTHLPYCYSTMPGEDETPTMTCLAFEFLPPPPGIPDRFGVARAEPAPNPNRENPSIRAAEKIGVIANADRRIQADEPLRIRIIEKLRSSLAEAGYGHTILEELIP